MNLENINKEVAKRLSRYPQNNRHLVEIKESNIEGAGLGLFAKADIPRGTLIDCYYGKRLTAKEWGELDPEDTMYIMEINDNLYIDGNIEKNFISFCNDARGLTRIPGVRNNCRFELTEDEQDMALYASRNIKAGEEIFVFYGNSYWNSVKTIFTENV